MSDPIDDRLLAGLHQAFGDRFRDRRAELMARWNVDPPRRPGGAVAVAAFAIHHTAGAQTASRDELLYDDVWRLHTRTLGWDAPGYGICVPWTGVVELGVLPSRLTYGVYGRHAMTYNVCLPGNYNRHTLTAVQLDALYRALCCLDDAYGGDGRYWRGHREWALKGHGTACPGASLLPHVQVMRGRWYGAARPRPEHYEATP